MTPEQIDRLIRLNSNRPSIWTKFMNNIKTNKKTIKKIIIYLIFFIMVVKPQIPAKITINIINAFVTEYTNVINNNNNNE